MFEERILPDLIPRELLFADPLKCNPRISPDGKKIVYMASFDNVLNLWIKTIDEEDDRLITDFKKSNIRIITGACKKGIRDYMWVTNRYIIYFQDTDGDKNWKMYKLNLETMEVKSLISCKYVSARFVTYNKDFPYEVIILMKEYNHGTYDLYCININSEKITLLAKNPGNVIYWIIAHNFQILGMVLATDDGGRELFVREDENSSWRKLLRFDDEGLLQSHVIGYTKNNKYIYMIDSCNVNTCRVVKVEIATGRYDVIAYNPEYDIWDSEEFLYNPDTYDIQAVCFNKYRKEWIILDETIKEDFEAIKKIDSGDFSVISCDDADKTWIIAFERDNGPVTYYTFNRTLKKGNFLFYNQPSLKDYTLSRMEYISFYSRDRLLIHGYITYPPGKNRNNLPVVLYVHGGPWWRDKWGYNPTVQWFANRGYACLQINYRGSVGYGKEFLNAGNREWGGKMQHDLVDAVSWVIKKGIADPCKIAIYGAGYGGYAAMAGATFTPDLFCCAIAIGCPGDLINFIQSLPPYLKAQRKEFIKRIGDPESEKESLMSRSPFYKVEQIKIPVFIAYSLNEQMVNTKLPYHMVRAIQSKCIEVEYIVFTDECYGINKGNNRIKLHLLAEKFLARNMGGRYEYRSLCLMDKYITLSTDKHFGDIELVDKILNEKDASAFEFLVKYYRKPLLKHLINMTGNVELSLELLQETFLRAWTYLYTYSFDRAFFPWICQIATNLAIKHGKIENDISSKRINLDEITLNRLIVDDGNMEDRIFIQSMINSLKEPYKIAMHLRFFEDMSYKDIANIIDTTENQVKKYLFRAKKLLQKYSKENAF